MPDTVASVNSHCTDKLLKEFTSVLKGEETTNQKELDDKISNVAVVSHGESFGVSSVCASAAASLQNISTIQHLATVYRNEGDRLSLPYLVCPILCSGIYGIGKLKIGQFCITPLPAVCFTEQVTYLKSFHNQLLVVLRNKFGASSCAATNQGHCVPLDKVEQPFDLISDTANACGLELGKHIGIIVCVNGSELYNAEKEKYEIVSGQLKTADEMVTQVENMVCSRDGVVGVVNPFIPKDTEAWQKLHSLIGQRCYIMTDCAELFENGTEVVSANCAILRPATTITQTVANCSCYEARGHAVMMSLVGPTTTSMLEMLADLVVVSGCRFVKIPHFKDMASVYISHLLNTRLALVSADMYDICKAHNYSTKDSRDGECSS
jgi:enolase